MRKDFGAKPWLYPMPVLIIGTYDENGTPNAMNAAWGGISEENEITICVSDDHKTTENLLAIGAFTVSPATEKEVVAADFVGIVSGNDVSDKLQKTTWHAEKSAFVDAPTFAELPMVLACRVKNYDAAACRLVGEIVNVSIDTAVLDDKGKVDLTKFSPIVYDPIGHTYRTLGPAVGRAFFEGKKLK